MTDDKIKKQRSDERTNKDEEEKGWEWDGRERNCLEIRKGEVQKRFSEKFIVTASFRWVCYIAWFRLLEQGLITMKHILSHVTRQIDLKSRFEGWLTLRQCSCRDRIWRCCLEFQQIFLCNLTRTLLLVKEIATFWVASKQNGVLLFSRD